jgi:hypothetical protein
VLQLEPELKLVEAKEPPPATLEAKVEICFFTCELLQAGHVTWPIELELITSSSNGWPQSLQTNSNNGIYNPPSISGIYTLHVPSIRCK